MILIIDDDRAVRSSLSLLLKQAGYATATAEEPEEALTVAREHPPELFILDMNFSVGTDGEEGMALLGELHRRFPAIPVILITAWGSIRLAVDGIKAGAADFVTKPWNNEQLLQSVRTALSLAGQSTGQPYVGSREELDRRFDFSGMIGADRHFLQVLDTAGRVSTTDAPVLIFGESGTGKELLAEAIHNNSNRRNGPFVKVNLGGIPATLFESEMFGHKKGAFTDAHRDRVGRFQLADGGTIFLDEIGDLDLNGQVKLLRVLQDRSFEVLGTSEPQTADFRVICATNRDLDKMVADGQFREDLYYRVNLISLRLASLRERPDDIPLLVHHFVENLKIIYGCKKLGISSRAVAFLKELSWPGNVRELKNLVERTVLVSNHETLEAEDFQAHLQPSPSRTGAAGMTPVGVTLEQMEESMIKKALEFHGSNISRVARSLGLSRAALYRRLEKYGISP